MGKVSGQVRDVTDSLPETFSRFCACSNLRTSCGSAVFGKPVNRMCEKDAAHRVSKEILHQKLTETHWKNEHLRP